MRRWLGLLSIVAVGAGIGLLLVARLPDPPPPHEPAGHSAASEWESTALVVPGLAVHPGAALGTVVAVLTPATRPAVVVALAATPATRPATPVPPLEQRATPGRE